MNKRRLIVLIIGSIILVIGLSIAILDYIYNKSLKRITNNIEINPSNCRLEEEVDTHGGFLGDGDYFAKLSCSKIDVSKHWKELPLSESLDKATKTLQCTGDGCKDIYERFNIPNITNGYYYFLDRHGESDNKYDDTNLNDRTSWNYTIAILDKDTNIIYYYEIDT